MNGGRVPVLVWRANCDNNRTKRCLPKWHQTTAESPLHRYFLLILGIAIHSIFIQSFLFVPKWSHFPLRGPSPANKINNIWRQQAANLQQFWYIKKHPNLPIEYSFRHFCVRHFIWYYCSVSSPNCQLVCRTRTHQNKPTIVHFLSVHSSSHGTNNESK